MKKLNLPHHEIICTNIKEKEEISVNVFGNGIFITGGTLKNNSTEEEIKTYSISLLEKCKNPIQL